MDIFFKDPNEIPLPPEEVRLSALKAEPWPDGRRVRIYLEVDPFQKRPCADLIITNAAGEEVARANILETISRKIEINMHLREAEPGGEYNVQAVVYYQKLPSVSEESGPQESLEPLVVDRGQTSFTISPGS
ncbi:MAG: hypothetical protein A2Z49_05080 [Chloroflexi bacterium RBG_19FT_COMBO_56_12]|nr:MAG: hypothetical protein A2Z49_05080 [Chloroflexi bacterium RBG_19FT_COMBO_56_12]